MQIKYIVVFNVQIRKYLCFSCEKENTNVMVKFHVNVVIRFNATAADDNNNNGEAFDYDNDDVLTKDQINLSLCNVLLDAY